LLRDTLMLIRFYVHINSNNNNNNNYLYYVLCISSNTLQKFENIMYQFDDKICFDHVDKNHS
jgi:hypothetical protein